MKMESAPSQREQHEVFSSEFLHCEMMYACIFSPIESTTTITCATILNVTGKGLLCIIPPFCQVLLAID